MRLGTVLTLIPEAAEAATYRGYPTAEQLRTQTRVAPVNAATIMARAKAIEDAGFDGIWTGDGIGRHPLGPDALSVLSVAAAGTSRVELGISVLQVPLRPAIELTKRVLTVHAFSDGRFTFGVGAGSTQIDFDTVHADYEGRFRTFDQSLDLMARLWNGESVDGVDLRPWPEALGGPRIVVGAWGSDRWLRRAARKYDGWIGSGAHGSLNQLREAIKRFRDFGGERAMLTSIRVDLTAPNAPLSDDDVGFDLVCGPESASERLERLADIGFDDVVITGHSTNTDNLRQWRALLPQDTRPPITQQKSRGALQMDDASTSR